MGRCCNELCGDGGVLNQGEGDPLYIYIIRAQGSSAFLYNELG